MNRLRASVQGHLGLPARLAVLVGVSAAIVLSVISVLIVDRLERDLIDDARASAERVLASYLDESVGGWSVTAVIDETATTRFFYLDADGEEIPETDFVAALVGGIGAIEPIPIDALQADNEPLADRGDGTPGPFPEDPGDEDLLLLDSPVRAGDVESIDLGELVVGIVQSVELPDGSTYSVGVSSPLQPVSDSIDAIRRTLFVVVPALVLAIAAISWLAASRTLRHVHAISTRARSISASNLDQRVPVPPVRDEIHELADTVNHMLDRIERSHGQQRQLVADAAHELRSPVAASRVQLEVGLANPDSTDWASTASTVLAEQEQLGLLIDDLLALARMAEAGPALDTEVDLDEIVLAEARRSRVAPVTVAIRHAARIVGDPGLLDRALRNLIDNAARHARSCVEVELWVSDSMATISVDDDGPGIPPDQREAVFDRFTRLDEARNREHGGSGLGLAIAREVAESHGGTLRCTEGPLGGARFTLALPVHDR